MGADWCGAFLPFKSGLIWFYTKQLSPTCGLCSLHTALNNVLNIYNSSVRAERLCLQIIRLQFWLSTAAASLHAWSMFVCSRQWDQTAQPTGNSPATSTFPGGNPSEWRCPLEWIQTKIVQHGWVKIQLINKVRAGAKVLWSSSEPLGCAAQVRPPGARTNAVHPLGLLVLLMLMDGLLGGLLPHLG